MTLKLAVTTVVILKYFSSGLNKICYLGRGRLVMHDGMQCDPIQGQGQGQGHEPLKVGNSTFSQAISSPIILIMGAGK